MKNWVMIWFFSFFSINFYYFMETIYFKDIFSHWELLEVNRHQSLNSWLASEAAEVKGLQGREA